MKIITCSEYFEFPAVINFEKVMENLDFILLLFITDYFQEQRCFRTQPNIYGGAFLAKIANA